MNSLPRLPHGRFLSSPCGMQQRVHGRLVNRQGVVIDVMERFTGDGGDAVGRNAQLAQRDRSPQIAYESL
jgi:hypothetical protein